MNLDFTHNAGFSWYVVLLLISGAIMLAMAAIPRTGQGMGWRIINLLLSLGFLGYGIYLAFIFQGGTYFIFFKVFFVPVVLVVNFVRTLARRRSAPPPASAAPAMPQPAPGPMAQYPPAQMAQQYSQPGMAQYPGQPGMAQYPGQPGMAQYPGQDGRPQYPGRDGMAQYPGRNEMPGPGMPPQG